MKKPLALAPRPARATRQRLHSGLIAVVVALVVGALVTGCSSAAGGQATAGSSTSAQVGTSSSSQHTDSSTTEVTSAQPTTPSQPATGSNQSAGSNPSTGSTTESDTPIDLTTPAATPAPTPATEVAGPEQTRPTTAAQADIVIVNDTGSPADQLAKNAIADITAFWEKMAPQVFGQDLPPLTGGYWSVDPDGNDKIPGCLDSAEDIRQNAVYCPSVDAIVYDRVYLARIMATYSDLDVAFTFAHEFGHALQKRFVAHRERTIVTETQADCFAGVWAKSVTDGLDPHFAFDADHLDRVLGDYVWEMGDPAGTDPQVQGTHGGVFDRVSATQEGYLDGADSCVDNFNDQRVFATEKFTTDSASTDGKGNLDLPTTITQTAGELNTFWATRFGATGSGVFKAPSIRLDQPRDPSCDAKYVVSYCPATRSIDINTRKLAGLQKTAGDFATATAITLAYTQYLQDAYGADDPAAGRVCTAGAFAGFIFANPKVFSPGDLDEAVKFLVFAGRNNTLVDTGDLSAWDRLDAFRTGIYQGIAACHVA